MKWKDGVEKWKRVKREKAEGARGSCQMLRAPMSWGKGEKGVLQSLQQFQSLHCKLNCLKNRTHWKQPKAPGLSICLGYQVTWWRAAFGHHSNTELCTHHTQEVASYTIFRMISVTVSQTACALWSMLLCPINLFYFAYYIVLFFPYKQEQINQFRSF